MTPCRDNIFISQYIAVFYVLESSALCTTYYLSLNTLSTISIRSLSFYLVSKLIFPSLLPFFFIFLVFYFIFRPVHLVPPTMKTFFTEELTLNGMSEINFASLVNFLETLETYKFYAPFNIWRLLVKQFMKCIVVLKYCSSKETLRPGWESRQWHVKRGWYSQCLQVFSIQTFIRRAWNWIARYLEHPMLTWSIPKKTLECGSFIKFFPH